MVLFLACKIQHLDDPKEMFVELNIKLLLNLGSKLTRELIEESWLCCFFTLNCDVLWYSIM